MLRFSFLIFIIWTGLMSKLTITTGENVTVEKSVQNQIHQVQSQMFDMPIHHHHEEEDTEHDEDPSEKENSPFGRMHSLEIGAMCVKGNPQACKYFPEVTCVWVEEALFVCRCDFQHTWDPATKQCIANVYAPCSGEESDCGSNMECRPDSVGANPNEKMCRCKKGYKVEVDKNGLPSKCIIDEKYVDDDNRVMKAYASVPTANIFTLIPILLASRCSI